MSNDNNPAEGDTFECETCGMQILVTKECQCESGAPFFTCCDKQLAPAGSKSD